MDVAGRWKTSAAAALLGLSALSGCSSIAADDLAAPNPVGAADTGVFPNLNVPPPVAAAQLSEGERAANAARLNAAANAQAGMPGPSPSRSPEELRRIALTHGQDTINAIEAN